MLSVAAGDQLVVIETYEDWTMCRRLDFSNIKEGFVPTDFLKPA